MRIGMPTVNIERGYQWPGEFARLLVPGVIGALVLNFAETAFIDTDTWAQFSSEWGGWKPSAVNGHAFVNEFWNKSWINLDPREATAGDYVTVATIALGWEAFKNTKK